MCYMRLFVCELVDLCTKLPCICICACLYVCTRFSRNIYMDALIHAREYKCVCVYVRVRLRMCVDM